jgi:hypothetical protein
MDYDALDRLVTLRDSGAISETEFESLKAGLVYGEAQEDENFRARAMTFLARSERAYLAILRGATLVFATILVIYAAWLGLSGLYNVSRNAASITEKPVSVDAEEVAKVDFRTPQAPKSDAQPSTKPNFTEERQFYLNSLTQYYRIYQTKFEVYRKQDDKLLSRADFDKRFLNTELRIKSLKSGEVSFAQDKADVISLIKVMADVAAMPETVKRLQKYKAASRIRVNQKVKKVRYESYCSYYSVFSYECLTYDSRPVNYTETKVIMKLPDGVVSHVDLFAAYQSKYIDTLLARRDASKQAANAERQEIIEANARGQESILTAVKVAGGFLALMFFFLLIAIERHQRKLAKD